LWGSTALFKVGLIFIEAAFLSLNDINGPFPHILREGGSAHVTLKLRDVGFTGEACSFIATSSLLPYSPNDAIQRLHLEAQFQRLPVTKLSPIDHIYSFSESPVEIERVGWEASRSI
jgi:hypothetical protein